MAEAELSSIYDHHRGTDPLLRQTGKWRGVIFLCINIAAFLAINLFWQYLATGKWLDLSPSAYHHALTTPLSEMFLHPLSIFNHPWMILISAILLAAVIFVPVVMAVLYHELIAMIFILIVAGVGHSTVLAFFQAGGCILAARTRLRSDMPFFAAILGLSPLGVYLYVFATAPGDSPAAMPLQRWLLCAPVGLAVLLAILMLAASLAIAKLTRFRPGVMWPILLVMLIIPVALFYNFVGDDELEYSLIVEDMPGRETLFQTAALEKWRQDNGAVGLNQVTLRNRIEEDLQDRKAGLIRRCEKFLTSHGNSHRAAAVLWVEAHVQSLLLDGVKYEGGLIKYSDTFTTIESRETWQRLVRDYHGSPHAALAVFHLGELAMREGKAAEADELLYGAAERLSSLLAKVDQSSDGAESSNMLAREPDVPAQRNYEHYKNALLSVERLIWLVEQNKVVTDQRSATALAEYLKLNPQATDYYKKLVALISEYENTEMGDNLKLAIALVTPDTHERVQMLIQLAENKTTDAAIEANFELGILAKSTARGPEVVLIEKLKKPQEYFSAIVAARKNPWQRRARAELAWLTDRPKQP